MLNFRCGLPGPTFWIAGESSQTTIQHEAQMARDIAIVADVGCQAGNAVGYYEDPRQSVHGFDVLVANSPLAVRAPDQSNAAVRDRGPLERML
jgi:hypothetical protein